MEVQEALSQVAEIHRHLLRTECYRGYRSPTMAVTSMVALAGAALQPWVMEPEASLAFVRYWLILAGVNLLLVSVDIVMDYYPHASRHEQRIACRVVAQFIPSLCGGVIVTLAASQESAVPLLPGLWCILFSMGVFASRPYLPHGVGWVGLFYLIAGSALLALAGSGLSLHPWGMGSAFGVGQMFLALVLYWNLERPELRHEE